MKADNQEILSLKLATPQYALECLQVSLEIKGMMCPNLKMPHLVERTL